jgi:uncharacterized membrane protein
MGSSGFIKATLKGGLVFLVPVAFVAINQGKAFEMILKVAKPLGDWLPVESFGGIAIANLIAIFILLAICFVAGLVANLPVVRSTVDRFESAFLSNIPGYTFAREMANSVVDAENAAEGLTPVIAHFDDNAQLAFEIERTQGGTVVLYLPGAPNPWSGSVIYMPEARVERLNMKTHEAIKMIQVLGKGSARFAESQA